MSSYPLFDWISFVSHPFDFFLIISFLFLKRDSCGILLLICTVNKNVSWVKNKYLSNKLRRKSSFSVFSCIWTEWGNYRTFSQVSSGYFKMFLEEFNIIFSFTVQWKRRLNTYGTAQNKTFSAKDLFSKCEQIRNFRWNA